MIAACEMFSELSQTDTDVEVVMGDDSVVNVVGRGSITFQRESIHQSHGIAGCIVCSWV